MKKCSILLALSAVVTLTAAETSLLLAGTPDSLATSAKTEVQTKLLDPLQKRDSTRSRFSRASPPPMSRRIRILDSSAKTDAKGHSFVAFAIDESYGMPSNEESAWTKNTITGCVYPDTGDVLVKRGEAYFDPSMLVGAKTAAAPAEVCQAK